MVSASYGKNIVAICNDKGKTIWTYKTKGKQKGHNGHHDVHLLPNGNILFHDIWSHLLEINLKGETVWEYEAAKQNRKGPVHIHAFARLANGDTMIVESGIGRIIHVDPQGKLVKEFPLKKEAKNTRWARMTDEGHYVMASEDYGIVEYGSNEKIVWEFDNFELVGNGLACWETLEGEKAALVRSKLAELK